MESKEPRCIEKSLICEISTAEYVTECVDIPKFLECCKQCGNYDKIWSCPPFVFSAEEIWKQYSSLLLYGKKINLPQTLIEKTFTKDELSGEYSRILKPVKQKMLNELLELEKSIPHSMALSAGSCDECVSCARAQGLPCRRPKRMRHSIESIGGDVSRSLEIYLGEKLLWAEADRLPEHFFLLGGLLKP